MRSHVFRTHRAEVVHFQHRGSGHGQALAFGTEKVTLYAVLHAGRRVQLAIDGVHGDAVLEGGGGGAKSALQIEINFSAPRASRQERARLSAGGDLWLRSGCCTARAAG